MLGKKNDNQENATLSQGIFAQSIMMLYSKSPEDDKQKMYASIEIEDDGTPLRRYFLDERDDVLLKIILNCFSALQEVFKEEWEKTQENILWKSTGFRGVMKSLPVLILKGIEYKVLTQEYFFPVFYGF